MPMLKVPFGVSTDASGAAMFDVMGMTMGRCLLTAPHWQMVCQSCRRDNNYKGFVNINWVRHKKFSIMIEEKIK